MSKKKLKAFKRVTDDNESLKNTVTNGWSKEKSALLRSVQPYWTFQGQ